MCARDLSTGFCALVWLEDQLEGNGGDRKTLSVPHYNTQMWQSATVDIIICMCLSRALSFFLLVRTSLREEVDHLGDTCIHFITERQMRLIPLSCLLGKYRHESVILLLTAPSQKIVPITPRKLLHFIEPSCFLPSLWVSWLTVNTWA